MKKNKILFISSFILVLFFIADLIYPSKANKSNINTNTDMNTQEYTRPIQSITSR